MANLNLDFSKVREFTNLSVGKHILKVTNVEAVKASTGSDMLRVTFVNSAGESGLDNFVLTETALWKLQTLLKALFKTEFKGSINLNTDSMIGKTCEAVAKEEEYVKQDGTQGIRTVIDNYRPVSDAGDMGIAPQPAVAPAVAPQPAVAPAVAPQPAVAPAVAPQPAVAPAVAPQPAVAPAVAPQPAVAPARPKRPWE